MRGARLQTAQKLARTTTQDRERGFRVTESGLTLVTPDMLGQALHITR